jgi:hypothetical protein
VRTAGGRERHVVVVHAKSLAEASRDTSAVAWLVVGLFAGDGVEGGRSRWS